LLSNLPNIDKKDIEAMKDNPQAFLDGIKTTGDKQIKIENHEK
jgi:hypothetical protein